MVGVPCGDLEVCPTVSQVVMDLDACCVERVPVPLAEKYASQYRFYRIDFNRTYGPGLPACDEPERYPVVSPWYVENHEQPLIPLEDQYNLEDYKVVVPWPGYSPCVFDYKGEFSGRPTRGEFLKSLSSKIKVAFGQYARSAVYPPYKEWDLSRLDIRDVVIGAMRLVKLEQDLFWVVELALELTQDECMKTASLELSRRDGWHWTLARHPDHDGQWEGDLIPYYPGSDENRWPLHANARHAL